MSDRAVLPQSMARELGPQNLHSAHGMIADTDVRKQQARNAWPLALNGQPRCERR